MANYVSLQHIQEKRMLMERHAYTHTLFISNRLTITILANDIIYDSLY